MDAEAKCFIYKFKEEHFEEYNSWFTDGELNQALGGVDDEWLNHILQNKEGIDYAVFQNDKMVGVLGILFPTAENPFYVLTNIAVRPELKKKGLGSIMLHELIQYEKKKARYWLCYVAVENRAAQHFFEKNNWTKDDEPEDGMYAFKLNI